MELTKFYSFEAMLQTILDKVNTTGDNIQDIH